MRKIILILVTLVLICTAYAFPAMASEKNNTSEILSYGRGVLDAKNVVAGLQLNNESLIFTVSFDSKYEPKKISDDSIFVSRPPTLLSIFDDLGPVAQKILDRISRDTASRNFCD